MNLKYGKSKAKYIADGVTTDYVVPYPYLNQFDVQPTLYNPDGTLGPGLGWSWLNASTIRLASAPAAGMEVWVERNSSARGQLVDFTDSGTITERDLDLAYLQSWYTAQESRDEAGMLFLTVRDIDGAVRAAQLSATNAAASAATTAGYVATSAANAALALTYSLNSAASASAAAASAASAGAAASAAIATCLLKASNLSDLASIPTARTNLGLGTGDSPTFANLTLGAVGFLNEAANILAQRNGTNAQASRVYNTFTDASNWERLNVAWVGNAACIYTDLLGTGVSRSLKFGVAGATQWQIDTGARFSPIVDASYDLGGTVNRIAQGFFSAYVVAQAFTGGTLAARVFELHNNGLGLASNAAVTWAPAASYGNAGDLFNVADVKLVRDGVGILAQRNGVNAQAFNVYNTFTDASNYERGRFAWSSNILWIGMEKLGTGSNRDVIVHAQGNLRLRGASGSNGWLVDNSTNGILAPEANNVSDFGTSVKMARDLYWGRQALSADGTASLPGMTFASDNDTGWFSGGGGVMALTQNATNTWYWDAGGHYLPAADITRNIGAAGNRVLSGFFGSIFATTSLRIGNAGAVEFSSTSAGNGTADAFLLRENASQIAMRNGTNGQIFRIYGTYTDASNYERAAFNMGSSGLSIGTFALGTGVARDITISPAALINFNPSATYRFSMSTTAFYPSSSATCNLGSGGAMFKDSYVRRRVGLIATITYSASMTPDASLGDSQVITATNGTAFTINAPTSGVAGQSLEIILKNTFGVLGAATWTGYKLAAWTNPANTFNRAITFRYDGTTWNEVSRTPADVPN